MRSFSLSPLWWRRRSKSKKTSTKKSSKRNKKRSDHNVVVVSDDSTHERIVIKDQGPSQTPHTETRRTLEYDSDTPLSALKRKRKGGSGRTSRKHKGKDPVIVVSSNTPVKNNKGRTRATNTHPISGSVRVTRSGSRVVDSSANPVVKKTGKRESQSGIGVKRKRAAHLETHGVAAVKQRKRSKKNEWNGIRTRSSPIQFARCVEVLSEEQRMVVKELGFGKLLNFKMDGIPAKLGHYVVDNFNPDTLEMTFPCGKIIVDEKVVEKILGIPRGGVPFNSFDRLPKYDEGVAKWRKRYPENKYVTPKQMVDMIQNESEGADSFEFRLDFLMCFYAVMVECHKQGSLKDSTVEYLRDTMDFAKVDWCGILVNKLRTCKNGWNRDSQQTPFAGPLALLTLVYVDCVTCKGIDVDDSVYPITFWNFQRLREREKLDIQNGGFGTGKFRGLSACENVKTGTDEPSIQEKVLAVDKLVDLVTKTKKRIESSLGKLYDEHPDRADVVAVKAKYETVAAELPRWMNTEVRARDTVSCTIEGVLGDLEKMPVYTDGVKAVAADVQTVQGDAVPQVASDIPAIQEIASDKPGAPCTCKGSPDSVSSIVPGAPCTCKGCASDYVCPGIDGDHEYCGCPLCPNSPKTLARWASHNPWEGEETTSPSEFSFEDEYGKFSP